MYEEWGDEWKQVFAFSSAMLPPEGLKVGGFLHTYIFIFILDLVQSLLSLNSKIFWYRCEQLLSRRLLRFELPGISLSLIEVFPFDVPFLVSEESVKVIQVGEWDDMLFNIVIVVGSV